MSRIIVKNLPQSGINESELKKHFADIDNVTDIKLKYNDYGNFRRFAFVGFKSTDAADRAIDRLNNSFIGSSKIAIEPCKAIKEIKPDKLMLPGRGEEHENNQENGQNKTTVKSKTHPKHKGDPFEAVKNEPEFREFVNLQRNLGENVKTKQIWSDDVQMDADNFHNSPAEPGRQEKESCLETDILSLDKQRKRHHRSRPKKKPTKSKPKELFVHTVKLKGFPSNVRRKDVIDFFKPLEVLSVRLNKKDGVCYASFKDDSDRKFALRKNNHFWTTFRIKMWRHDVKRSRLFKETIQEKCREKEAIKQRQQEIVARTEPVEESGRLFVRNLNYSCTQDDLEQIFSKYGELTEVHFPIDKKSSLPKGYAYVEFQFPQNAKKAYDELNGTIFQGRNFHLIPSEPKPEPRLSTYEPQAKQTNIKVDDQAGQQDGKQELENNESKQPVRLLPLPTANSTDETIGTTPTAPNITPNEAPTKTFDTTSAYKKDKLHRQREDAPKASNWNILFLGQNALADVVSEARGIEKSKLLTQHSRKDPIAVRMALGDATVVDEMRRFLISNGIELDSFDNTRAPRSRTVILVKNLPSSTHKDDLLKLFETHGRVGRIIMPPNGLTAIVEMEEPVEAKLAFRKLAYSKFKDSVLYLEWAPINVFREKSLDDQDQDEMKQLSKAQTGTKILVKNVPFEATPQELKKVFATFGELNFVRLPKKIDGSHRGFGFVDYLTREDALRAFRGLSHSTHLYGRKLVLEWAKTDNQQQSN